MRIMYDKHLGYVQSCMFFIFDRLYSCTHTTILAYTCDNNAKYFKHSILCSRIEPKHNKLAQFFLFSVFHCLYALYVKKW